MKKSINRVEKKTAPFWPINLLVVLLLVAVCYWKLAPFRESVDAKLPWLKAQTAGFFPVPPPSSPADSPAPLNEVQQAPETSTSAPPQPETTPTVALPASTPYVVDIQKLSETPSDWPKKVKIKRAMEFPVVSKGVVMGTVQVPVGSETVLRAIKNGMLGLEYNGGGGWHKPEETDVIERVQNAHRPSDSL